MSSISTVSPLRKLWNQAWALSPVLTVTIVVMFLGGVVSAAGIALDPRQIIGEPAWLKPTKFFASMTLYGTTILYFLSFLSERRRFVRVVGAIVSVTCSVEMMAISLQAARGVRSHFNVATPFDLAVFSSMGTMIFLLWVTMTVLAVMMLRARIQDRPLASALRMGLVVGIVGGLLGYFMLAPKPDQIAVVKAGGKPVETGSHTLGGKDGGPGLPLVGWSTTAGDMRPAHFLGLHGMQVLPILAALLARRRSRSESQRLALLRSVGVGYLGLMGVLAVQALRGLPIVQWDMTGAATLAVAVLASLATLALNWPWKPEVALATA
jgi:hypothetical protein